MTDKPKSFCIVDPATGEFYRRSYGAQGWWSHDPEDARIYRTAIQAAITIHQKGHHVTHPNREPIIGVLTLHYAGPLDADPVTFHD